MPGKPRKSVKPVPTPPKLNAEDADAADQRAPTKKWLDSESQTDAVRALAATLKPDEGYDPDEWKRIAARGRWGGSVVGANYKRLRKDFVFRSACTIAYCRERPFLIEIVNTICAALDPCEIHLRDRMLRIALEFEPTGEILPGFIETPREAADALLVDGTADWEQPYGLRRGEIEIALRHRWPGITDRDIDAGLQEAARLGRIYREQYEAKNWTVADDVFRLISLKVDAEEVSLRESSSGGFSPSALAQLLGFTVKTLNSYAHAANVRVPAIGKRNFRYDLSEVRSIANHACKVGDAGVRAKALAWLKSQDDSKRKAK